MNSDQMTQDQDLGFEDNFGDRVSKAVYDAFLKLSKKGKPQLRKEWTLLSAVVSCHKSSGCMLDVIKVLSLGTGSKCIGKSKMSLKGDILNDSHAEIMARRAFILFLYQELAKTYTGKVSEYLTPPTDEGKFLCSVKPGISFHFFSSHTPCGDASIIPKTIPNAEGHSDVTSSLGSESKSEKEMNSSLPSSSENQEANISLENDNVECRTSRGEDQTLCSGKKRKRKQRFNDDEENDQIGNICVKSFKFDGDKNNDVESSLTGSAESMDVFRTGAKCVPGGEQDSHGHASDYHTTGALRTKPGRGERTESMSCSDKLAKWNIMGCQGALLSTFLAHPIYFKSVVIGRCPYSQNALERAIISRLGSSSPHLCLPYRVNHPDLHQSLGRDFEFSRSSVEEEGRKLCLLEGRQEPIRIVPCPAAIAWNANDEPGCNSHDVTVNGRCQGVTKTELDTPKARSKVCSRSLFQCFHRLVNDVPHGSLPLSLRRDDLFSLTYDETKMLATDYQETWTSLLQNTFPSWIRKSRSLLSFKADTNAQKTSNNKNS